MVLNTDLKVTTSSQAMLQELMNETIGQQKMGNFSVKGISSFPESKEYH